MRIHHLEFKSSFLLSSMDDFGCIWNYEEGIDELKQKLLYTTIELETVKMEANQEMIKNKENVKNLLNLLQMAYKERDEAKNQLQKVFNKLMLSSISHFEAESPLVKPNSSITESTTLSPDDTFNNNNNPQSHGSPVAADSFFDAVSSPDFSSFNDSCTVDPNGLVIENIVKGKKLPEKGRLLQCVMDAGPLLQTLLVAGPLPRWRNPPPLQPFEIPPVLMNGTRMCSSSLLNFSYGVASDSSCFNHNALVSVSPPSSTFVSQFPSTKRQRLV